MLTDTGREAANMLRNCLPAEIAVGIRSEMMKGRTRDEVLLLYCMEIGARILSLPGLAIAAEIDAVQAEIQSQAN